FFFQAEDGIRDRTVTGVQTCALPILFDRYRDIRATGSFILIDPATNFTAGAGMIIDAIRDDHAAEYRPNAAERLVKLARSAPSRSEERRVGKECRAGWSPEK